MSVSGATTTTTWSATVNEVAFGSLLSAAPHEVEAFEAFAATHLTGDDRALITAATGVAFSCEGTITAPAGADARDAQAVRDVVGAVALLRAAGQSDVLRAAQVTALLRDAGHRSATAGAAPR